jgi:competence protein ComEC
MTAHFYDVGEGLAALIDLPDGRRILVDAGDSPRRRGCDVCEAEGARLLAHLRDDLRGGGVDLLWITHQHSDHIGGAPELLETLSVGTYVDNGRDARKSEVGRAREAAQARGVAIRVVDPDHPEMPLPNSPEVTIRPIVPPSWPHSCAHDPNDCSIALRIDFCGSSILFTGDAEHREEAELDVGGPVTLLQVGHHGGETSTTPAWLGKARPRYAVISAGRPGEGLNRVYCHPRAAIVERLTRVLGGPASKSLQAFDGARCDRAQGEDWITVPASDRLWATERDGDVVLTTLGDGRFEQRSSVPGSEITRETH